MVGINELAPGVGSVIGKDGIGKIKTGDTGFADLLKGSIEKVIDTQYKSEEVSKAALMGDADISDVIQAVSDAEMTLNTVVAIRDKVVQAYEQIMRMPI